MKLTKEEKELLNSVEQGEWKQIPDFKSEVSRYRQAARATIRKDKRVNIRMTERDLVHFQKRALQEGLPYQTFISSILHKYINGLLAEKQMTGTSNRVI
jgi:predicted DNA binding CopG/RHH family protein